MLAVSVQIFEASFIKLDKNSMILLQAPELREMAVPDRAPGDSVAEDSVGFLFISLPVIVVILSVLIIGYLVRRRQLRRASAVEIDEKTPLFSSI